MVKLQNAKSAYNALNGLICVYKPACVSVRLVQHTIVTNLCRDLNILPEGPREQRVEIVGATNSPMEVRLVPNYADDPLVVGPRYQHEDFKCHYSTHLGLFTSGVLLIGINEGTQTKFQLHAARPTRAYKIQGQLGKATDTYFWNGRTVERASYGHVTREKMDRVIGHMQAAHQKTMFGLTGLDMESQSMYELASKGLIRPTSNKLPVLYGIKCVHFEPPNFTLEVQAINEYEKYLCTLVHDLGIQLKTTAYCTAVQCIRQGKFDVNLALLRKHWSLKNIIENMKHCQQVLTEHKTLLRPTSPHLSL